MTPIELSASQVIPSLSLQTKINNYNVSLDEPTILELTKKLGNSSTSSMQDGSYKGLIDLENNRIICLSKWNSTIIALSEHTNVKLKYRASIAKHVPIGLCWMYLYGSNDKNINGLTPFHVYRYTLIQIKSDLLDYIHKTVSEFRLSHTKELPYQYQIYQQKYEQAKEILALNMQNDDGYDYPFVTDYSKMKQISLVAAANEIIFLYKSLMHKFSKLETMRLKFTNQIKLETDINKLKSLRKDFDNEYELYGNL